MYKFHHTTVWSWEQNNQNDHNNLVSEAITVRADHAWLLYTEQRAYVDFERKRQLLTGKQLLYVQADSTVTISPADHAPVSVICIAFQVYRLEQQTTERLVYQLDYSTLPINGYVVSPVAAGTPRLLHQMLEQSSTPLPDNYICDRHLHDLLQQMMDHLNRGERLSTTAKQVVNETIQSMITNCQQVWTREEVARSRQFNVSHFSRVFKTISSYSFSELLSKIRLNQARYLLLTTSLTLDQIAHRSGFISGLYLSRRFKLDCGSSPSSFKAKLKGKNLRIAAMQQSGDLLALGVVPVAASFAPWQTSPLLHERLLEAGSVNVYEFENIALLKQQQPDLILIPDYLLIQNTSRLRQLELIAPVLFLSPWRYDTPSRITQLGEMLGKKQEALNWLEQYQLTAAHWQQKLQRIIADHETAACYEIRGDNKVIIWLRGGRSCFNFYEALHLKLPPELTQYSQTEDLCLTIHPDELLEYAADHMFVIHTDSDNWRSFYDLLQANAQWSRLPALQNKQIYPLPLQNFWVDDAATLEQQLPIIVQTVEAVRSWAASK